MDFAENIKLIECQQRSIYEFSLQFSHASFRLPICFHTCVRSQADYFNTTQLALLMVIVSFLHPLTYKKMNWTFAFISDDPKHSNVSFIICPPLLMNQREPTETCILVYCSWAGSGTLCHIHCVSGNSRLLHLPGGWRQCHTIYDHLVRQLCWPI